MPKKILIINKTQFGYHTDYYKYCEYLRDDFQVTYVCFDSGFKKLEMEKVRVIYISSLGFKFFRGIKFILSAIINIRKISGVVFIHYFENCHILKYVFPSKKIILDIRTLSVSENELYRHEYDKKIKTIIINKNKLNSKS